MFNFLQPNVPTVQVDEVKHAMDTQEDYVLLDVRTPAEYRKSKLAGSINIPLDGIDTVTARLKHKDRLIYVYCLSGSRSAQAVSTMIKLGYTRVFHVASGLLAWRAKGFPESQ